MSPLVHAALASFGRHVGTVAFHLVFFVPLVAMLAWLRHSWRKLRASTTSTRSRGNR